VVYAGQTIVLELKTTVKVTAETGSFEINIVDSQNNPVATGPVYLTGPGGSFEIAIDNTGHGRVDNVPTGTYTISLQKPTLDEKSAQEKQKTKLQWVVYFSPKSTKISAEGASTIDAVAQYLASPENNTISKIECRGFSGEEGSGPQYDNLCLQRAIAVKNTLTAKLGQDGPAGLEKATAIGEQPEIHSEQDNRVEFWVEARGLILGQPQSRQGQNRLYAKVIQYPTETQVGRITQIERLSDTLYTLYSHLIVQPPHLTVKFIRQFTNFTRFHPQIVDGKIDWDVIHDKAIAEVPSFSLLTSLNDSLTRQTDSEGEVHTKNWAFRTLLSGSMPGTVLTKLSKSKSLLKLQSILDKCKVALTIVYGQLRRDDDEQAIYDGIFLGVGLGGGLSLPGGNVFSSWTTFKTVQAVSIRDFDHCFARLTVLAVAITEGYSVSFFSFHDDELFGKEAVSMYVGSHVEMTGTEYAIYGGIWINLD